MKNDDFDIIKEAETIIEFVPRVELDEKYLVRITFHSGCSFVIGPEGNPVGWTITHGEGSRIVCPHNIEYDMSIPRELRSPP